MRGRKIPFPPSTSLGVEQGLHHGRRLVAQGGLWMHRPFLLPPTQNTPTSKRTSSGSLGSSLLALFKLPRLDTFVPHSWCRPPIPTLSFAFSHSGFFQVLLQYTLCQSKRVHQRKLSRSLHVSFNLPSHQRHQQQCQAVHQGLSRIRKPILSFTYFFSSSAGVLLE